MTHSISRYTVLCELSELLQSMLSSAHNQDWDSVAQANQQRNSLIDQLRLANKSDDDPAKTLSLIERIRKDDASLFEIATQHRDHIASKLSGLSAKKSGCSEYLSTSSGY